MKPENRNARFRFEEAFQKINFDLKNARLQSGLDGANVINGEGVKIGAMEAKRILHI